MDVFINKYSAYCLLGPQSKNARFENNLFVWEVGKKKHFSVWSGKDIDDTDISFLKSWDSNFHYISDDNLKILKNNFDVDRQKLKSSITTIDKLDFTGKKNKNFRNYLNRYKNLEICDNFKDIADVKQLIEDWSNTSAQKYFRDFSGKNYFFFKQNYHINCDCVFLYDGSRLIAFGVSSPVEDGKCTYVIGKALCLEYHGLSEVADIKLYEKLLNKYGTFSINLGQAKGGLETYKGKFPNTIFELHYDGKIKI